MPTKKKALRAPKWNYIFTGSESAGRGYYAFDLHIAGLPGPRGGKRTLCGKRIPAGWVTRERDDYRVRWAFKCPQCLEAARVLG